MLGAFEKALRDLQRPVRIGIVSEAHTGGIKARGIKIETVLIGFAAGELRGFQFPAVMHQPQGGDAEGDMGGIQPVMRDGRGGIILAGQPVHIGRGAQRRFARIAGINKKAVGGVETVTVGGGQLHQQIMGMLAVHQRRDAIGGFAGRQQQRIAAPADKGIQADHGAQA